MNINKFDVLALSNNKKIVVLDKINFMDNDFLFANEVLYDETMATNKYKILLVDYKNKVLKAKDIDSVVTGRSHGHPARSLRNNMTRQYVKMENEGAGFEELEYLTLGSLRKAVQDGDTQNGSFMAGQIAGLIHETKSCKEIIEEMENQAEKLLKL